MNESLNQKFPKGRAKVKRQTPKAGGKVHKTGRIVGSIRRVLSEN